jgi:hypothetical protein
MSQPELETRDRDYQAKMYEAVSTAVIAASLDPRMNVAMLRTGEVTLACLMQIAVMAATSAQTSSPTKTRKFCELVAKRLQSMITAAKKNFAEDGLPFAVVEADLGPVAGPLN